jgi:23S rRNA (uracil1939-C5)-methyltransferase
VESIGVFERLDDFQPRDFAAPEVADNASAGGDAVQ